MEARTAGAPSFGAWLKQRRRFLDLTQEQLADDVGCSAATIFKLESGDRRPSLPMAALLAERLQVPAGEREACLLLARGRSAEPAAPATPATPATPEPAAPSSSPPTNLPAQLTSLLGREVQIEQARSLLLGARLVTLTGPAGVGKTRLALQVAGEMLVLGPFPDGVFFVRLADISDPALVPVAIASALGIEDARNRAVTTYLVKYLSARKLLLVLDNFEQVLGAAEEVGQLASAGMGVKVLVTSRTPLRIRGEREFAVPPLSLPDTRPGHLPSLQKLTQYEAVRLFIERATAVKADFDVTDENAPAVAEICVRLDGLPLAIELAAARVRLFAPQALLTRLSQRLKMLTGGARDLSARQQTLRAAIDWSYDLLEEGEKQLFRRMAVFQGGRSFEALETVCNSEGMRVYGSLEVDYLEGIESLVSQSLLQQREGRDGEPRLWLLQTIHEYAREKLEKSGEAAALEKEHALYFMRLAEEAEPHLIGKKQREWLDRLEDEYDNLRAALAWAWKQAHGANHRDNQDSNEGSSQAGSQEAAEIGLRIGGAIWRYWHVRGLFTEGREQLERVLSVPEAVLQACSPGSRARALNGAGYLARSQGDYSLACSLSEAALALGREAEDRHSMSLALNNLGVLASGQGDYEGARALYEESLVLRRELGDKWWGIATSLNNLGVVAGAQGDDTAARALLEESLALSRELGDKRGIAVSLTNLGDLASAQEDYAGARALFEESLALGRELGDKKSIAMFLVRLGEIAAGGGQVERGAKLLGAVEGLLHSIGAERDREYRLWYERAVASARSLLGEETFERAWQEGQAMCMEQAMGYALEQSPG